MHMATIQKTKPMVFVTNAPHLVRRVMVWVQISVSLVSVDISMKTNAIRLAQQELSKFKDMPPVSLRPTATVFLMNQSILHNVPNATKTAQTVVLDLATMTVMLLPLVLPRSTSIL